MCISLYVCIKKQCMKCWFQQINMALLWAARSRYGTSITCSLWFPWTRGWPTVLNCTGVGMSACKVISKPRRTLIHGEGIHQLHSWWGGTGSMMDRCLAWLSPRPGPFSTAWEESIPLKAGVMRSNSWHNQRDSRPLAMPLPTHKQTNKQKDSLEFLSVP